MKTLYFDLSMGAAGDMLTAALFELCEDREQTLRALNALGIPGVEFRAEPTLQCGITGTRMQVLIHGEEEAEAHHDHHDHDHHEHHHHAHLGDIEQIVAALAIPPEVREDVNAVYRLIAEAESKVHGEAITHIHFHEVGTMDAIADVTAVCCLLHKLSPDRIAASPVHVGSGTVRCAHGVLPVPAPATALLLTGIPSYGGEIPSELCTPTGAALLRHFVSDFGAQPMLTLRSIGYGMGKKTFDRPNCVRAMWGETADRTESVAELTCDLDDLSAEQIAFACERITDAGALEALTIPVTMKKSRPGTMLKILCKEDCKDAVIRAVFRHTSTIGIRETPVRRYVLERRIETVETKFGAIRKKVSSGYGVQREKYEYEDLAAVARDKGMSIDAVLREIGE